MATLYENINSLCEERGITGGKLCTDIGISKGILTDLKMGRQTGLSTTNAQKIASYLNVTVGYLLGDEDNIKAANNGDGLSEEDINTSDSENKKIMCTLYERLHSLCEENGIKGAKMCRDLGFSKSLMTDLKFGRKAGFSAITAQKIASYFDVTVGYLLGVEERKKEPKVILQHDRSLADITVRVCTDAEFFSIVDGLNKLNPEQLANIKQFVNLLLKA